MAEIYPCTCSSTFRLFLWWLWRLNKKKHGRFSQGRPWQTFSPAAPPSHTPSAKCVEMRPDEKSMAGVNNSWIINYSACLPVGVVISHQLFRSLLLCRKLKRRYPEPSTALTESQHCPPLPEILSWHLVLCEKNRMVCFLCYDRSMASFNICTRRDGSLKAPWDIFLCVCLSKP